MMLKLRLLVCVIPALGRNDSLGHDLHEAAVNPKAIEVETIKTTGDFRNGPGWTRSW